MVLYVVLSALLVLAGYFIFFTVQAASKLEDQKNRLGLELRSQDRIFADHIESLTNERNSAQNEVKRLTNKLIEVQNHANMVEKDAAARIADFKKQPLIACMNDGQVQVLAEILAVYIRQILDIKKEYIN